VLEQKLNPIVEENDELKVLSSSGTMLEECGSFNQGSTLTTEY